MRYLIGIDLGTSGTKTVLFDERGCKIAAHTVEYPLYQPQNGWAEQDPDDWWEASCEGIKSVINQAGIAPDRIVGVGISGQMHGLIMLDKHGNVLRKSIIWCDQRTEAECDEIERKIGRKRLVEITANLAMTGFTASKILWVKNNEPSVYEKCAKIMLPKDYVRYRLTGEFATDISDASGMQLVDVPHRCWSDEVLNALDIDKSLLGKIYESCEVTGKVSAIGAEKSGLYPGTIVVGGAGDNFAAAVGTNTVSAGKAFTTLGTSGVIFAHTDEVAIDSKGRVHTFCSAVPGKWCVMSCTQAAGLSLKWVRDTICSEEIQTAKMTGRSTYDVMNDLASSVPIGANRLIFLPYLMGERSPHVDPNARGVFFGLSPMHNRAHLIRSVMEGVAYSQRDCMEIFKEMNVLIEDMYACGGGARSELWRNMLSNLYRCPVSTLSNDEGPALGAVILAGVGAGIYDSVEYACENIVKKADTINYKETEALEYDKYYKIFRNIYPHIKNDFWELTKVDKQV